MTLLKNFRIRHLIFMIAGISGLLNPAGLLSQAREALVEKGSFLLRPETIFQHYCAPCHGETGRGDGRYFGFDLKPLPRDLTDKEYMNSKTDEELIAAIQGGSASIGKSNLCPPWGKTLSREKIAGLVRYLRSLSSKTNGQGSSKKLEKPVVLETSGAKSSLQLTVLMALLLVLVGLGWLQWRKL